MSDCKDLFDTRVIVGIRHIKENGEYEHTGFWGIISSCSRDGFIVRVEGGSNSETEWLPLDLTLFKPANNEYYEFSDTTIVTDVDYEVYLISADSIKTLEKYT